MRSRHPLLVLTCVLTLHACHDSSAPLVPTSVELVTPPPTSGPAGVALATSPTFVVKDQNGNVMSGVAVTVVVSQGGGSLINAPTTSASGPTSVGQWTLGSTAGTNSLTITVASIAPLTLIVTSFPGPPTKIVAKSATNLSGTVGQAANPLPSVQVTDAFDNPVSGAVISVGVTGGGSISSATLTSDGAGNAALAGWTLGTVKGPNTITMTIGSASVVFTDLAAAGPIQTLAIASGDAQTALAGTSPPSPIRLSPTDQYGNRLDSQTATFSIGAGRLHHRPNVGFRQECCAATIDRDCRRKKRNDKSHGTDELHH